jgi:uncharacterized membrane protein
MLALLIIVAGIIFRLYFIDRSDLWLDEIWTANAAAAHRSYGNVLDSALADQHPPLYDLLLHSWLLVMPDMPVAGRYLSLLFGAVGLWMTFTYAARISGSRAAGLFAVSLLALNYFHAAHSIEMRYYALVYMLALGAISHLILYLRADEHGTRDLVFFGAFALGLLYTHVYGAFLLCALGFAAVMLRALQKISLKQLVCFLVVAVILIALYSPFVLRVLRATEHSGVEWMTLASPAVFFEYLYNYSNKNPVEAAVMTLPLLLCFRIYKKSAVAVMLLAFSVLLTYLLGYLFSVLRQPMLHERYTMVYFPSFLLLAAVFWADVFRSSKRAGLLALGTVVALSAIINLSLINPFGERLRREPWRAIAKELHEMPDEQRCPVYAEEPDYINYYLRRNGESGAQQVATRAVADERFWYIQTEYDHASIPGRDSLAELERREFSGRFALILFGRKD